MQALLYQTIIIGLVASIPVRGSHHAARIVYADLAGC